MILKNNSTAGFVSGGVFVLGGIYAMMTLDIPLWGGGVAVAIGVGLILLSRITTIIIDKNTKKIIFRWKRIIGEKSREYNFDQAQRIELRETYNQTQQGRNRSLQIFFIFSGGEEVVLASDSGTVRMQGVPITVNTVGALGQKVAGFVGIPYEERRAATATQMISAVQTAIQNATQPEGKKQKEEESEK